MNRIKAILMAAVALFTAATAQAKVRLPHLIADNMVLQQQAEARLWGWDKPGTTVRVTVSWNVQTYQTRTDKTGRWQVKVTTPRASYTPLSIVFDDGEPLTVKNILAGEVWVCGGQSNMEMPVRGFWGCPVEGFNATVAESAAHKGIRYAKIPSTMSMKPLDDAPCQWLEADPQHVADCSATGYFFARMLNRTLNLPVGLILANKGGSRVESWLDRENLKAHTQEPLDTAAIVKKYGQEWSRPLVWGNGTFHPVLNYTVKGILFYQGCSNVGDPAGQYTERLKLLVEQWRRDFAQGQLPFYFVQIAPYENGDVNGDWGPKLREQQFEAAKVIANSGIVCTQDLVYPYEYSQIHPAQKRQVGERLAFMALQKQYGMEQLMCESPSFGSMKTVGDTCYLTLNNLYEGLSPLQGIEGFEVAGADRVFHPATARYTHEQGVIVTCKDVPAPVAVRYCFRNFQLGNARNQAGLPLFPFRTDNW